MKVSFRNEQDKIKVTFTLKRLIKKRNFNRLIRSMNMQMKYVKIKSH